MAWANISTAFESGVPSERRKIHGTLVDVSIWSDEMAMTGTKALLPICSARCGVTIESDNGDRVLLVNGADQLGRSAPPGCAAWDCNQRQVTHRVIEVGYQLHDFRRPNGLVCIGAKDGNFDCVGR